MAAAGKMMVSLLYSGPNRWRVPTYTSPRCCMPGIRDPQRGNHIIKPSPPDVEGGRTPGPILDPRTDGHCLILILGVIRNWSLSSATPPMLTASLMSWCVHRAARHATRLRVRYQSELMMEQVLIAQPQRSDSTNEAGGAHSAELIRIVCQ